jgi:hypothetical protein
MIGKRFNRPWLCRISRRSLRAHSESDDPELRNMERHIYEIGSDIDEYLPMIVQASK